MSILIGAEIEKALKNGSIRIEPLDRSQVGPGSIDLTLGNDFRVFKKKSKVYHVKNDSRFEDITRSVHVEDGKFCGDQAGRDDPWDHAGEDHAGR